MLKIIFGIFVLFSALSVYSCVFVTGHTVVRTTPGDSVNDDYDDAGLIIIPGTYVYYYSHDYNDLYFYGGYWWRPWQGGWYRSGHYSGPWVVIQITYVPQPVIRLPHRWKNNIRRNDRIPWREVKVRWREWERDRYWEKRDWRKDSDDRDDKNRRKNDDDGWDNTGRKKHKDRQNDDRDSREDEDEREETVKRLKIKAEVK